MKRACRRICIFIAVIMMMTAVTALAVSASEYVTETALSSTIDWSDGDNFGGYDYKVAKPRTGYAEGHYIVDNGDGTVTGVIFPSSEQKYDWDTSSFYYTQPTHFYVETYDAQGNVTMTKTLPFRLPIFGAFLAADDGCYVAFGAENLSCSDSAEVWRIVKYDKNWNIVGTVSVNGGDSYTETPFVSTVSRMALSDDGSTLVLHAARRRYDGHQSNITFIMDTNPLSIEKVLGEQFPINHVSHSFGQFVRFDGDRIITVDHGDAYPRSFVLLELYGDGIDLLQFAGQTGDNTTNAIGSGFEVSDDGYLFVGCSASQNGIVGEPWDVFISCTDKSISSTEITWLGCGESVECARLVRLDGDRFVIMWAESDGLHWVTADGKGDLIGSEHIEAGIPMPPTQPLVRDGAIVWIQNIGATKLYSLYPDGAPAPITPPAPTDPADIPAPWAADYVNRAVSAGIVPTSLQGKYEAPITRAEFCALAAALYESVLGEITARVTFTDTDDENVEKMAALGVVNGMTPDTFSPDSALTREQAATILARLASAMGKPLTSAVPTFADNDAISFWAFAAAGQVQADGIMSGMGGNIFSPKTEYTRQQSIITIVRLMDLMI